MPRQADPAERRTTIVEAAYGILADQGLSALSMRSVAKTAGVTTGMVTHWFVSREALLQAAIDLAVEREERRAAESIKNGSELIAILAAFLPLDEARVGELKVWIAFWAASIGNETLLASHRRRYRAWAKHLAEAGVVPDVQSAQRLIAVVDGISIDAVLDPECWPANAQLACLRSVLGRAPL